MHKKETHVKSLFDSGRQLLVVNCGLPLPPFTDCLWLEENNNEDDCDCHDPLSFADVMVTLYVALCNLFKQILLKLIIRSYLPLFCRFYARFIGSNITSASKSGVYERSAELRCCMNTFSKPLLMA